MKTTMKKVLSLLLLLLAVVMPLTVMAKPVEAEAATIMSATDFADKCYEIATEYKTLYVMGCFGAPMTSSNKSRYTSNHSYNQQSNRTAKINAASSDTFGFDCVCLIKGVLWGWNGNTSKVYGGATYASNGVSDMSIPTMRSSCTGVSTDFSTIEIGEILFYKDSNGSFSHVGVYIGNGLAVESTPIWDDGVQVTAVANIGSVSGYNSRSWHSHGKLSSFISYSNITTNITTATISEGNYYFKNDDYKMYMISDSKSTGTIGANASSTTSKHLFKVVNDGSYYKITPVDSTNGYLLNCYWTGVASTQSGNEVTLWSNTSDPSQRWVFEEYGDGYLIHPADRSDLSITRESNKLYVKTTTKAANQIWTLEKECQHIYKYAHEVTGSALNPSSQHWQECTECGNKENYASHNWVFVDDGAGGIHSVEAYHISRCSYCKEYKFEYHSYTNVCDSSCNICGYERTAAHSWGSYQGYGTSTEEGHARTCTTCGEREPITEHIPKDSYSYSSYVHWLECTLCPAKIVGLQDHTYTNTCGQTSCTTCGYTKTIEHTYSNDCDAECNTCQATRTVPPHSYTESVEGNKKVYTCSICDDSYTEDLTPVICDHSYLFTTSNTSEATCTENGTRTGVCILCDHTVTESITALGHSYGSWYDYDLTNSDFIIKRRDCERCDKYETTNISVSENNQNTTVPDEKNDDNDKDKDKDNGVTKTIIIVSAIVTGMTTTGIAIAFIIKPKIGAP